MSFACWGLENGVMLPVTDIGRFIEQPKLFHELAAVNTAVCWLFNQYSYNAGTLYVLVLVGISTPQSAGTFELSRIHNMDKDAVYPALS